MADLEHRVTICRYWSDEEGIPPTLSCISSRPPGAKVRCKIAKRQGWVRLIRNATLPLLGGPGRIGHAGPSDSCGPLMYRELSAGKKRPHHVRMETPSGWVASQLNTQNETSQDCQQN